MTDKSMVIRDRDSQNEPDGNCPTCGSNVVSSRRPIGMDTDSGRVWCDNVWHDSRASLGEGVEGQK